MIVQVSALGRRLNDSILPKRFAQLERELQASGGPYFCGDVLTIVDLNLYVVCGGVLDGTWCGGIGPEALKGCPGLVELVRCVDQHPRVADWNRLANS
jgi:glutathione S-transferase